jgi:tetratricopeptide (TPR) repeat protein
VAEQVYQVPWQLFGKDPLPSRGLVLYWFPASVEEFKLSSLRTSRDLTLYSAQCVAMEVADASTPIAAKLEVAGRVPMVVLTDAAGAVLGRVESDGGKLKAPVIEKLVREELKKREEAIKLRLTEAKSKAKAGDNTSAIEALKAVWEDRCLFPGKAKDAAKELKKLGAPVDEKAELVPFEPVVEGPRAAEVLRTMERGLAAELAGRYDDAQELYARAERLDPADPTPRRYRAELYRHHTGEWAKARRMFEDILKRPADALTRAVALHGLGKMTIHEGAFEKGREMFEQSVGVYPLPLTYRNLAVYWNSEGNPAKTAEYVKLALDLDPEDAYNRVFAAVFMAASGQRDEAVKIAEDNEKLLPASYNLAAIYAQAGQRARALTFLRRHFYEYERYGAVRAEEMMEARVDAVFASLRTDPEFLALTALADGKLAMPMTAH